jgi:predicted kinase
MTHEPSRLVVLVGGVPGAGKSTVLARLAEEGAPVVVLDPDRYRRWFASTLPAVPYRLVRWAVHLAHAVVTLHALWRGPGAWARDGLLVHEPATRARRRGAVARLARARGWEPVLVVVDVPRQVALDGQAARGRVIRPRSFGRHWRRWHAQRAGLPVSAAGEGWARVHVVDRGSAWPVLRDVVGASRPRPAVSSVS